MKDPFLLAAYDDRTDGTMKAVVLHVGFSLDCQVCDPETYGLEVDRYFQRRKFSMCSVQREKELPSGLSAPAVWNPRPHADTTGRIERSGTFGGYAVSGWRTIDLAIWHITVWCISDDRTGQSYVVSDERFYPESITPAETFAVLRLIAFWEADGFR